MKRGTAAERGYDAAWRKLRAAHLAAHPWCLAHAMTGQQVQATEVDHITAHRGNDALRLDPTNLASLCKPCHSRKTAREDGGFGNAPVLKGEGEGRSTF